MIHHLFAKKLPAKIKASILTGGKIDAWWDAAILGVSLYPESVPTFIVEVDGQYVWHYIPPHVVASKEPTEELSLKDLVYHNCPQEQAEIHTLPYDKVFVFLRGQGWRDGIYMFSVDWWTGNDLLHCLRLDSGHYCFMPNHKVNFGAKTQLPATFVKIRERFFV